MQASGRMGEDGYGRAGAQATLKGGTKASLFGYYKDGEWINKGTWLLVPINTSSASNFNFSVY